ncbi:hypothetical protein ACIGGF_10450 [Rhodococcus sp. NPDC078407]|jgi:hypothetical protein|uniref:Lipoprotein n=1 Tax=Rhodococcus navarretei TaxID=3128981 RepID=A0ABU9D3C5_9NOCA|nr:hypothetical protein [Rhodococcus sp. KRD197]MDZ7914396.1 hypothetical protein [Rhodococcus sp. (in: high G+C Gram-positive bacteria)]
MTTTPRTHRRAALALLAALTLVIGGCGSDDSGQDTGDQPLDAGGPTTSLPAPSTPDLPQAFAGVDQTDPEQVMLAAATTLFSYTPADEPNQLAAAKRAQPLFDERYYADNAASFIALAPITGNQWQDWAQAGARVIAVAAIGGDDHPADQSGRVSRVVTVTQTATTPDGKTLGTNTFAAYFTATKLGVWRINAVAVR